MLVIWFLIFL